MEFRIFFFIKFTLLCFFHNIDWQDKMVLSVKWQNHYFESAVQLSGKSQRKHGERKLEGD